MKQLLASLWTKKGDQSIKDREHGPLVALALLPAVAWLVQSLMLYVVAEWGCVGFAGRPAPLGLTVVAWIGFAVSLIAIALALLPALHARKRLSRIPKGREERVSQSGNEVFLLRVTFYGGLSFCVIILMQMLPLFYAGAAC